MPTEIIRSWTKIRLEDLHSIAKEIWTLLSNPALLALDAEMGSGKTTLVRALLREAQITHFEGSPTFAIVQAYESPSKGPIYHLDCYRIENERDLAQLGLDELFEENAYFFVEWPDKIEKILPEHANWLYIRCEPEGELREIVLNYDN